MQQAGERLREEREALVTQAQQRDESDEAVLGSRRGDALPAERTRRADRLARMEAAMRRLEAQARAEAAAELQRRAAAEAARQRTGTPRRGQGPQAVEERPADTAQRNWTDPAWPILRTNNTGGEYCGTAPARVDETCQSMLCCDVTEATNDKQPAAPRARASLARLSQAGMALPTDDTGTAEALVATLDSGSYSAAAVSALERLGCAPYLATGRQQQHDPAGPVPQEPSTAQGRMAAKGRTPAGKAWDARRKVSVAPVCGQSKVGRGCRRWLLRGLQHIRGAWRLGCWTHNLRKMGRSGRVLHAVSVVWRPSLGWRWSVSAGQGAQEPRGPGTDTVRVGAVPPVGGQSTCQSRGQRAAKSNSRTGP